MQLVAMSLHRITEIQTQTITIRNIMSLKICNTQPKKEACPIQFVGSIKCQFKLPGLVRTDIPKQKDKIEKRLSQRLKNLDMYCELEPSTLLTQCNRTTEQVSFIVEVKVFYRHEANSNQLEAARWFTSIGRLLPKIVLGSRSLAESYAGLSTNIKPSYLFALEEALGLYEQQVSA